ncbi:MAG TPA: NAD(P)H-dependent oxidoreductase [Candidatus Saccharimonadales bacterium]|nr:NAD(P)H-dependent oxidoreductase [Candidatus Saccharimonadales bacterium]
MSNLHIAVLAGTTRPQRQSIHAAKLVYEAGQTISGIEVRFVDPVDYNFPGDGNDPEGKDPRYTELTAWADGFFIVTPEYNHSFPGSLKRMLDSELQNYVHKPVAFAGASSGHWGGIRAIESLVNTVREMGLVATFTDVQFPAVQDLFENGELKAEHRDRYDKIIRAAYAELIWMATALKWGRDNPKA